MPAGYGRKYPFGDMQIGDSFAVNGDIRTRLVSAASRYGARNNKKFSIRKDGDAFRCWRIS